MLQIIQVPKESLENPVRAFLEWLGKTDFKWDSLGFKWDSLGFKWANRWTSESPCPPLRTNSLQESQKGSHEEPHHTFSSRQQFYDPIKKNNCNIKGKNDTQKNPKRDSKECQIITAN